MPVKDAARAHTYYYGRDGKTLGRSERGETMAKRKIVKIDESKCNGCGECVPGCAEGALAVIDGKARLVKETYCDGLGACLGECPQGAITIEERAAAEFDAAEAEAHVAERKRAAAPHGLGAAGGGCPGSRMMHFAAGRKSAGGASQDDAEQTPAAAVAGALGQWPVQLALVPTEAPYYEDVELVLAADCVAYALGDFHERFLRGRAVAIACPKLDDISPHVEKLVEILKRNGIRGLVVVHMQVPCCGGIVWLAEEAARLSGRTIPVRDVTAGLRGEILSDRLTVMGAGG